MSEKVLIAMSGGVDSAVTAILLKNAGYQCAGAIMQLLDESDESIGRAQRVADQIGIPLKVLDFRASFKKEVISDFIDAYEKGKTPNPCIRCNQKMKFGEFLSYAECAGFDRIATGHYARIEKADGKYILRKAADEKKDQSYVLYGLSQEQMEKIILPLGGYSKPEIRDIAKKNGLLNADQADSQDICFVPDGDYAAFIQKETGRKYSDGDFVSLDGKILGRHHGIIHYTVGQRKGLGLSLNAPHYVCEKNIDKNQVILCKEEDFRSDTFWVDRVNWISGDNVSEPIHCTVRTRYHQTEKGATVFCEGENSVRVVYDEQQARPAPGQSAVFYDGDTVLGGGIIL